MPRFFQGYPWRFVITDRTSATLTFLDRLSRERTVTVGLNQPRDHAGSVPSDSSEINILHTDGDPFLAEGNRLVYGFRREGGSSGPPWVCRFAGVLYHVEDAALTGSPVTHYAARDPWQLLYKRPVRTAAGALPPAAGLVFAGAQQATDIAFQILFNSVAVEGGCHIDFLSGTVGPSSTLTNFTVQAGSSVGQAWDQLCATGLVDIVLDPLYDPTGHPGICVVFNAYAKAGAVRNDAIFAWDKPSRSLTGISRVTDGTQRENTVAYYAGQGGPLVALVTDPTSIAKYDPYWAQQFWPGKSAGPVAAMAAQRLALFENGATTYTFQPAPERSPIPLLEYDPGDWAPFYASKRLRVPLSPVAASGQWTNLPRIRATTLQIADNQTETVSELLTAIEPMP